MKKIVIIGAGMGGLTAAARLSRSGFDVTVLEAHIYPGGCAGTFYHQGYRFDAGATLAGGFYPGGPMDLVGKLVGIEQWPVIPSGPAVMAVHLPDGSEIIRWADKQRWAEHRAAFGREGLRFFQWQEQTAQALWDLALRLPAWPPKNLDDLLQTGAASLGWLAKGSAKILPKLILDTNRPVAAHLSGMPEKLRLFVDAQLLISAQATSENTNSLYGAAALDLPRRGVVHPAGGMGMIARRLAQAVQENGGRVLYRQEAARILMKSGRPAAVVTRRGDSFPADIVIANLPAWNIASLLQDELPRSLRKLPARPIGWGAFTLYLGLDESLPPKEFLLHHQIVRKRPLGEGNTIFLSLSPAWDKNRAPAGKRALTLSTHTTLDSWWELYKRDPAAYEARKAEYTQKLLSAAGIILPGLREAAELVIPGTPVSFQRFTRRAFGWVGGFPQTSLLRSPAPQISPDLWMVGDSIFPGQSLTAAALGGLRVAGSISRSLNVPEWELTRAVQTEPY